MDKLNQNLTVSNAQEAREVGDQFDKVISLAAPNKNTTNEYLIDDGEHNYEEFTKAVDAAVDGLENDKEVLVHCMAGISRSVSVCIATLAVTEEMKYGDAYNLCQRGFQHPNPSLVDSAKKYIREHKNS